MAPEDPTDTTVLTAEARQALVDARPGKTPWHTIRPADAVQLSLPHDTIWGPLTEEGGECPWPWEPQQLLGAPLGQYHCQWCGSMCVAGIPHPDYLPGWDEEAADQENPF